MIKKILCLLTIWKASIFLYVLSIHSFLPSNQDYYPRAFFKSKLAYVIWVWGNFDGYFYVNIARRGYRYLEEPFFPLYPFAIAVTRVITQFPYIVIGLSLSTISFFFALYIISKLIVMDTKKVSATFVFLVILLFPTSMFYGAVYNDALFFFFATLTLYFSRKNRWILASVAGALATATRLNGLALILPILIEYLSTKKTLYLEHINVSTAVQLWKAYPIKKIISDKIYSVLLLPLTFVGYLLYIQYALGDWNRVFTTMKIWHQDKVTFPLQVFWRYFKIIVFSPTFKINYWVAIIELTFVCFYIFLLIYSYKKIRLSYWVFFFLSILIPSLTGTFQGMPRYGLHVYPVFLSIALFLENKPTAIKAFYFTTCILLSLIIITFFTHGYFIA